MFNLAILFARFFIFTLAELKNSLFPDEQLVRIFFHVSRTIATEIMLLEELWVLEFFLFAIAAVMLVILAMILSTLADMIDRESEIKAIFISLY